jgi:hypothetical protein
VNHPTRIVIAATLLTLASTPVLRGQMSVDDAEKRLQERMSSRPAATQPMSEEDRLREQNTQLREDNLALRQEVDSLREALDHLMHSDALSTTRPAAVAGPIAKEAPAAVAANAGGAGEADIVGHYRGGSPQDGTAFLVTFNADGSYEQDWFAPAHSEPGHYQFNGDGTVDMWSDSAPATAPHHLWRISIEADHITLTPLLPNGSASADPPQVLTRIAK